MSRKEIQVHSCDRCGLTREQPARQDRPRDWSRVSRQLVPGGAITGWDLCTACSAGFERWLRQESTS